jgi:hypothetical protein
VTARLLSIMVLYSQQVVWESTLVKLISMFAIRLFVYILALIKFKTGSLFAHPRLRAYLIRSTTSISALYGTFRKLVSTLENIHT